MNFDQLRLRLRGSIGNPSTTDVPDANSSGTGLSNYINEAYQEIVDRYNHSVARPRARFTTIAGTGKYELAVGVGAIIRMWDRTNKQKLTRTSMDWIARNEFDNPTPATAKPTRYIHVDDFVQLHPIPDGAYNIEFQYRLIATPMTADIDIPILPDPWHRGIYLLARWNYWIDYGNDQKAASAKAIFETWASTKPVEADEVKGLDDVGVEVPTLEGSQMPREHFDDAP